MWNRNDPLVNPASDEHLFGWVPQLKIHRGPTFPAGGVVLRYGEHRGPHSGFGFQHIWRQHFFRIEDHDEAMERICDHVAKSLAPRTALHYETGARLEAFRLITGSTVLQLLDGDQPVYSVVTSGYFPRNGKGPRVGALAGVGP